MQHLTNSRNISVWNLLYRLAHNVPMKLQVDCYSGHKEGERPVRFHMGEHEYIVEEVVDQWYGPEHLFFKIQANDGNLYIIRRETTVPDGSWDLVSFRHTA